VPVYALVVGVTLKATRPYSKPQHLTRTVYVDRERYLPVRIVERFAGGGKPLAVIDYLVAERLPPTPENERLLRMSPHPGAKVVTGGR
jgi:hypothetical protein